MKITDYVTVSLKIGNYSKIGKSIEILEKAIEGKPLTGFDKMILTDVKGILNGIESKVSIGGYERY